MRKPHFALLLLVVSLSACRTSPPEQNAQLDPAIEALYGPPLSTIGDALMLKYGSLELFYNTVSFRNRNGRWPGDYRELTNFVNASDGYLWLGNFDRVEFKPLTNDCLEVTYVRSGQTRARKFTFGNPLREE